MELERVTRSYVLGSVQVTGVDDVSLRIEVPRFTVLSGPSGSGKTTLLNLIGCIDRPDTGRITVLGHDVGRLQDDALSDFRGQHVGTVFQTFNLLPVLSVYENVEYPLLLARVPAAERRERVMALLQEVGLADKRAHWPGQLSGGQRQRVAIARALVRNPALVLADEPTANLDSRTGEAIIGLMRRMQRDKRIAFIFSSHDPRVLAAADEVVHIQDGRITGQGLQQPREVAA
ncbi:MAG: ABC transporter ATP-binding protein [Aquincola tertiaricarbonis]|uniref:ABC transporter ATP-binding protein n=1 Tax=Aquincola sp. J276 TaxID=2898432 RepID=UPI002151698D|nr:ABC transporter ATP-binding protein [Aquincola sp. J276]MCR5868885.1 ABC transporter ATP-binding protein [Aquincola sp. J276]